ncbi:hypothetical protein Sru01_27670 [Sphaerisporangium rufum]|uniref:RDD domain-containing protein n=1 Tax=Sphaerisporangium rufum TaxID=1381558 RepID=A0A919R3P9_9ACTN|nr:RDD family protein [Sphaerisporangium rufum]GII77785.1 hypothetical protein Sru01_27670 [Sphaerisporangium rufum]
MAVAAWPSWEEWRFRLQPGEVELTYCAGLGPWGISPLEPLRSDLDMVMENLVAAAVPAILVVMGFLACLRRPDLWQAGRRAAGGLVLIAVLEPATPAYASPDACGVIPLLSAEWFATMMDAWGSTQWCLFGAAALVLVATRMTSTAPLPRPVAARPAGVTWHRPAALLVDYTIVVATFTFAVPLFLLLTGLEGFFWFHVEGGVVNALRLLSVAPDPERLIGVFFIFLYFWGQHRRWGRTLGKRLLRIRLVSVDAAGQPAKRRTALRTLLFPLLLFVPVIGPLALIADVLWVILDPGDRTLHDRLARTEVVRRIPDARLPA